MTAPLKGLPHYDPCLCTHSDWSLDHDRQMWVCGTCRKPAANNFVYNPNCDMCGHRYTIKKWPPPLDVLCPDCEF